MREITSERELKGKKENERERKGERYIRVLLSHWDVIIQRVRSLL